VLPKRAGPSPQPDLFSNPVADKVRERIIDLEPERTTPLEALHILAELKEMVK
jgi:hypothetical protein